MEPRMLQAVSPRQILERMLRNLKAIYAKEQDLPRSLAVLDLLLVLGPGSLEDLRDRGLVYAAMDCYGLALRDLQAVAARAPGRQTPELLSTIETLRHRAARVN
jgi:regulator of sirC expression with transglutaminase-like and TPR domain